MSEQRPVRPGGPPGAPPRQGPPGAAPQQRPQGPPGSQPQRQGPPGAIPQPRPGQPSRPQGPVMPQPGLTQRPQAAGQRPSGPAPRPITPSGQEAVAQRPPRPVRPTTPIMNQGLVGSAFPNGSGGGRMPTGGRPRNQPSPVPQLQAVAGPPTRETGAIPKTMTAGMEQLSIATPSASATGEPSKKSSGDSGSGRGMGRATDPRKRELVLRTRNADFDKRGGVGAQSGQFLNLYANYFAVVSAGAQRIDVIVRQYQVDFYPEEDNTAVKKRLFRMAVEDECNYVFDGMQMFTVFRFPEQVQKVVEDEHGRKYHIKVRFVSEVGPDSMQYEQFLNILVRNCLEKLQLVNVKNDYFDPQARLSLGGHNLEIWPGYKTALSHHDMGPLLNVDVGFKVLRTDNVLAVANAIGRSGDYISKLKRELIGQRVITRYNNKTYRIDDLDLDHTATNYQFLWRDRMISLRDYMMVRYNIGLTQPNHFLIVSHPTRQDVRRGFNNEHFLIPELCFLTGLSEQQRGNFRLMSDFQNATRKDPSQRVETLRMFAQRLRGCAEAQSALAKCGLSVDNNLVPVKGRQLPPERVFGAPNDKPYVYQTNNADWGKVLKGKLKYVVNCKKWAVVYCSRDKQVVDRFLEGCQNCAIAMGAPMGSPLHIVLDSPETRNYILKMKDLIPKQPDLIMTIVPNQRGDLYQAVKKLCYVDSPVASQVVTMTVLNKAKNLGAIASKVVAQIEAKLGAELWGVTIPMKGIMVIGYDAWADKGEVSAKGKMSIGAVVCTTNFEQTKFLSFSIRHQNHEELCSQLQNRIEKALQVYKSNTGDFPKAIIFYRDGVGEGQIGQVIEVEVDPIYKMLLSHIPNVRFAFVVVSKRINTKFFRALDVKTFANPDAGTIVDDAVTKPERYDFFLVSLSVNKGTVNPTSYNVIKDTTGLKPDQLQALTYKMTHLYYNWPGTVRVPAVCLYAHKLAYLVGECLRADPNSSIEWSSKLYYL